MNVVGKVGSLISQGVYSVATPFHPFGGAVDVIVVQQQDGTFRSTPWYVRFGKFQGVLKGAEKVVRISVNGVESNFHMYLDNSGEAYFVKEVDEDKGVDLDQDSSNKSDNFLTNGHRLDHSISDSGVLRLKDESDSSVVPRIQRTESDGRYYDFQDSFDDSLDLTDYGSNSYESIEGENLGDSQGSHPEMVLVSVDGHILTAPISESEKNEENVQLRNPQFHLGPAEETDLCETNGEFSSGENAWAADYISQLDASTVDVQSAQCNTNGDDNTSMATLEVCQREEVNICQSQETVEVEIQEDIHRKTDSEGLTTGIKKKSVFKSCLELHELEQQAENGDLQGAGSSMDVQDSTDESNASSPVVDGNEQESTIQSENNDELSSTSSPISSNDLKSPKSESGLQDHEVEIDESGEVETASSSGHKSPKSELGLEEVEKDASGEAETASSGSHKSPKPELGLEEVEKDASVEAETASSGSHKSPKSELGLEEVEKDASGEVETASSGGQKSPNSELGLEEVEKDASGEVETASSGGQKSPKSELGLEEVEKDASEDVETASSGGHKSPKSELGLEEVEKDASGEVETASSGGHKSPKSELGLEEVEKDASVEVETASGSPSSTVDTEQNNEEAVSNGGIDNSHQMTSLEDNSNASEVVEPQAETSSKGGQIHSGLGFEISLCGHELKAGMGSVAAAEVFEAHRILAEDFTNSATSILKNQNLVVKFKEMYLTWEKAAPLVLGTAVFGSDLPIEPKDVFPVEQDYALKSKDDDQRSPSSGRRWRLWPIPFRRVKTIEHSYSNASNEDVFLDSESGALLEPSPPSSTQGSPHKQFVRTNVPTSEQITSLNLKDGQNTVTFSFSTRVLGTQQVDAHIYLWKWNARIVISDVDGTITKSDVLGQFMPLVGKDWTQSGVARLFSAIKENGYQLLFLSARAIVQAYLTRNFLLNLKQDGKTLPNGPVVISPDGLFPSLFREVIRRAPHEFKIACLEDIKRLFPSDYNPFYAGFGNRDTDELSYRKIGIPKGKIFIINPKGEVAISQRIGAKSYTSLHTLVNDMFPPTSLVEQEDFNSWNYWRMPLPDVD